LTKTQVLNDWDGPPRVVSSQADGAGDDVPRIRYIWKGPTTDPVFLLQDCRDSTWEHIDVVCQTACEAVFRMERTKVGAGVIASTNHLFRDVRIYGNGLASRGFWARPFIDQNNEHFTLESCSVYGCTTGMEFSGQQSKEHFISQCRFESCTTAIKAGSSVRIEGGTIAVSGVAILLTACGDPVTMDGVGVEACARMLVTNNDTATSVAQPITMTGCRYEADQLHADGDMVLQRHAGPILVEGCRFGGGAQPIPKWGFVGVATQTAIFHANHFGSYGADAVNPIHVNPGVTANAIWGVNLYERAVGLDPRTVAKTTP
jgi:hypothetical protein